MRPHSRDQNLGQCFLQKYGQGAKSTNQKMRGATVLNFTISNFPGGGVQSTCFLLVCSEVKLESVSGTPDLPCSGYMRELQAFTARIFSQHLSLYHCTEEVERQ